MRIEATLIKFATIAMLSVIPGLSNAETVRLYSPTGAFVSGYDQIMDKIVSGHHNWTDLEFSKTKFPLKKFLGTGGTTVVVSVEGGKALRLPKTSEEPMDMDDEVFRVDRDWLKDYLNTAEYLKSSFDLPVPGIYSYESRSTANYIGDLEYVMVEEIQPEFSLSELLAKKSSDQTSPDIHKLMKELSELAVKSSSLVSIRDLHGDNIVYDQSKGWVLLDFSKDVVSWSESRHQPGENILSGFHLPGGWSEKISTQLAKIRSKK